MLRGPVVTRGGCHPDPHVTCSLLGTEPAPSAWPCTLTDSPARCCLRSPWEMRATLGLPLGGPLGAMRVPTGWSLEVSQSSLATSLQIYDVPNYWPVGV